jgi:hypothetical protein
MNIFSLSRAVLYFSFSKALSLFIFRLFFQTRKEGFFYFSKESEVQGDSVFEFFQKEKYGFLSL